MKIRILPVGIGLHWEENRPGWISDDAAIEVPQAVLAEWAEVQGAYDELQRQLSTLRERARNAGPAVIHLVEPTCGGMDPDGQ